MINVLNPKWLQKKPSNIDSDTAPPNNSIEM